ncbi:hypothetical protein ACFL4A_00470 [bacterium]
MKKMKKIISISLLILFVNTTCFSSGYSFVPNVVNTNSSSGICTSNIFNIIYMIANNTSINLSNAANAGHVVAKIKKEKKIIKNIDKLFKSSGSMLFDFGKLERFFIKFDKTQKPINKDTLSIESSSQNQTISSSSDLAIFKDEDYMIFKKKLWIRDAQNNPTYNRKDSMNKFYNYYKTEKAKVVGSSQCSRSRSRRTSSSAVASSSKDADGPADASDDHLNITSLLLKLKNLYFSLK